MTDRLTATPLSILMALCPKCRLESRCRGASVAEAAKGGITCRNYSPRSNPKARISREHILALPDREPCADCACRKGSTPNGTHHSMADFEQSVATGEPFLCHDGGFGRVCAGWLRAAKARIRERT